MTSPAETRSSLLEQLDRLVEKLLDLYRTMPDPDIMVYELWTAQDVLAHLTFWHESFARNVSDLANGRPPAPLKGKLGDLNQAGVDAMKDCSLDTVLARFEAAHRVIQTTILNPTLGMIPYRKGSRDYTPDEHLEIVRDHIAKHLGDVARACKTR